MKNISHPMRKFLSSVNLLRLFVVLGFIIFLINYANLMNYSTSSQAEVNKSYHGIFDGRKGLAIDFYYEKIINSKLIFVGGFARSGKILTWV